MTMNSTTNRLTDEGYWEAQWRAGAEAGDIDPAWDPMLATHLRADPAKEILEIGCYPGRFLVYFAKRFGYRPSGVDFLADTGEIQQRLRDSGVEPGDIVKADFFAFSPARTWDVVSSFGFVEHFDDLEDVVRRHVELTRPGGHVVIGVPNLHTVAAQLLMRDVLAAHNMATMDPRRLATACEDVGADVLECRYVYPSLSLARTKFDDNALLKWPWIGLKVGYHGVMRAAELLDRAPVHKRLANYILCIARRR